MNNARLCIAAMQITLPSLLVMVALLINLQVSVNLSAVQRSGRERHIINEVVYNCHWAAPVRVSPRPQRLKDLASAVRPRIVNFMRIVSPHADVSADRTSLFGTWSSGKG